MTRDVTLREMVEAMSKCPDSDVFRWFQDSKINDRGEPTPTVTLRVTMEQVRREVLK